MTFVFLFAYVSVEVTHLKILCEFCDSLGLRQVRSPLDTSIVSLKCVALSFSSVLSCAFVSWMLTSHVVTTSTQCRHGSDSSWPVGGGCWSSSRGYPCRESSHPQPTISPMIYQPHGCEMGLILPRSVQFLVSHAVAVWFSSMKHGSCVKDFFGQTEPSRRTSSALRFRARTALYIWTFHVRGQGSTLFIKRPDLLYVLQVDPVPFLWAGSRCRSCQIPRA